MFDDRSETSLVDPMLGEDPLSYFELTTLVAFCHFAARRVETAVIEVGLGHRVIDGAIREGIATARWPGRLEELGGVLLDGAHNPDGADALASALGDLIQGAQSSPCSPFSTTRIQRK